MRADFFLCSLRSFAICVLCALACVAVGCAGPQDARVYTYDFDLLEHDPALEEGPMPILVLDQPTFSGDFQPFEVLHKSYEASDALTRLGVPNVAPWEYQRSRRSASLEKSANLAWLLEEHPNNRRALRLDLQVVVLSGRAWRQVEDQKEVQDTSPIQGEIRLNVTTLSEGRSVVEMVVPFEENPLKHNANETPDRWPQLGLALQRAMGSLTKTLSKRFDPLDVDEVQRTRLVFNPVPMFHHDGGNRLSVYDHLRTLDPLDARAHKVRYYQYLYPSISMDLIEDFQQRPGGLWVENPGPLAEAGLQEGDFVVAVQGRDALGLQTLARFVMLPSESPIFIKIIRDEDTRTLVWKQDDDS